MPHRTLLQLAALSVAVLCALPAGAVEYAREVRWNRLDDPAFASPGYDDSAWQRATFWQLPESDGVLWARSVLTIPEEARAAGYRLVWLDVLKSNEGARRAYERCGFKTVGELPFATELGEIGFRVMARREIA